MTLFRDKYGSLRLPGIRFMIVGLLTAFFVAGCSSDPSETSSVDDPPTTLVASTDAPQVSAVESTPEIPNPPEIRVTLNGHVGMRRSVEFLAARTANLPGPGALVLASSLTPDTCLADPQQVLFTASADERSVEAGEGSCLVLVLAVDPARRIAQITLIHPYLEYATASDIVIDSSVSGVTYPVVVQAAMRGAIPIESLGNLVTRVTGEVVNACLSSLTVSLNSEGLSSGTALRGPFDVRSVFKTSERVALNRLWHSSRSLHYQIHET